MPEVFPYREPLRSPLFPENLLRRNRSPSVRLDELPGARLFPPVPCFPPMGGKGRLPVSDCYPRFRGAVVVLLVPIRRGALRSLLKRSFRSCRNQKAPGLNPMSSCRTMLVSSPSLEFEVPSAELYPTGFPLTKIDNLIAYVSTRSRLKSGHEQRLNRGIHRDFFKGGE